MIRGDRAVLDWFESLGWKPFRFQRAAWTAFLAGSHGLIHASTGTGKTYAAYLGPVMQALREKNAKPVKQAEPLRILWITPLKALSKDTQLALQAPLEPLGLNWDVGVRTGDTSASQRAKQKRRLPTVLVTTPESLSLFLSRDEAREQFSQLQSVVVDEWHELLSTKRGVLLELALARLKKWAPQLKIWGLSATLGNLDEAASTLFGAKQSESAGHAIIEGNVPKTIVVDSVLPPEIARFPWAGHLGTSLAQQVVAAIGETRSALVFTNTRSQTELWYQAILHARPDWAGLMAMHHGSLDRKLREWVEERLKAGLLRCVVCTSTLDLGVDFTPVDRVLQIGSPKGVARLLQRAGRSGHQPKAVSRVTCVPTNALELIEIAAARAAIKARRIESRRPCRKPLDVLAQHVVTCGIGGGFCSDELLAEVRTTAAFADLTEDEWQWTLDFVVRGGEPLKAYPDYHRVVREPSGRYVVTDPVIIRRHRLSIGTIVGDAAILVRFRRGPKLGTVEESFAAKLKPGDRFHFAGRTLEFIRIYEQTVWVKKTKAQPNAVPRWMGGRMPLSSELAAAVREQLAQAKAERFDCPEMEAARRFLEIHARRSHLPGENELLCETMKSREGHHLFLYPFEGRLVHEGLAALVSYRLSLRRPTTFSMAVNDYGIELLSRTPIEVSKEELRELLSPRNLVDDVLSSVNVAEIARRQFREIARVAGLVFPGMPHAGKTAKQLQASATLFYNVFREYDPENLLLRQADSEVLDRHFEQSRLEQALERMRSSNLIHVTLARPTPLGFPLIVERTRESISSEKLADRIRRMVADLESEE
jgi:ATP-dependent Lhr-like helicase